LSNIRSGGNRSNQDDIQNLDTDKIQPVMSLQEALDEDRMGEMVNRMVNVDALKRTVDKMQWTEYLAKFPIESQNNMFRSISLPKEVWSSKVPKEQFKTNQRAITQLSKQICLDEKMTLAMIKEW